MRYFQLTFLLVFLAACQGKKDFTNTEKTYFDIEGYFKKEALRLQQQNPKVEKRVSQNDETEEKEIKVTNWETELDLFTKSDINKPAWKNSYKILKHENQIEYISTDTSLKTRKVQIGFSSEGTVKHISIVNKISNPLYTSTEQLNYFPDSIYSINKDQDVQVIGKNTYQIVAKFKEQ